MNAPEIKIDPAGLREAITYALDNNEEHVYTDTAGTLYHTSTRPEREEIPTVWVWGRLSSRDFLDEHHVLEMSKDERSAAIHHMAGVALSSMRLTTATLISTERGRFLKTVGDAVDGLPPNVINALLTSARNIYDVSVSNDWKAMREAGEREVCRYSANNLCPLSAHRYDAGDIPPFIKDEKQRAALALCAEAGVGVYGAALGALLKNLPHPKEYKLFLFTIGEHGRLYTVTSMK